jgi:Tfp pilus assembly protein PilF
MFFNSCKAISATIFILLLTVALAYAQRTTGINSTGTEGNEEIQGRVFFPPGNKSSSRPVVKLQSLSSPELTGVTDRDGNFRFTTLRPDEYTVLVLGGDEFENASETVSIGNSGAVPAQGNPGQYAVPLVYQIHIYLKPKRANTTGLASTSNAALASVPAPARGLFQQALTNARAGDHAKAIEQLKSVIAQAPRFALAYNELAVQYLKKDQPAQAAEILKAALEITPNDFTLRLNYGIALLNQKKFEAAEAELRLASQNHSGDSATANYYLGMSLVSEQKYDAAQSAFETVVSNGGDKLAPAHKYLGGIYWRNKKYRPAAAELEKYLQLEPQAPDAAKIRGTIRDLRQMR